MKTITRIVTILAMLMVFYVPAFSQSSIWSNDGLPTGFGTQKDDGQDDVFIESTDDTTNGDAIGAMPISDGLGIVLTASLLYGIYLVRKKNSRETVL